MKWCGSLVLNLGGRGRRGLPVWEKSMNQNTVSVYCLLVQEAVSKRAADRESRERRSRSLGTPEVILRDFISSWAIGSHWRDLSKAVTCLWSGSELVGTCESQWRPGEWCGGHCSDQARDTVGLCFLLQSYEELFLAGDGIHLPWPLRERHLS